ncbi:MAG: hypothetical protein HC936_11145 [Leptolyngbyaceae cyanobacterium SU_3_3]|nr:hypothetical protein [Leptolyngbyaceae cyanobacterium SU_3_3]
MTIHMTARLSLWAFVGSFLGVGVFGAKVDKKETMTRLDIHIREFIADRIGERYPEYNEERLVRRGATFMRQDVVPQIDPRHTYLTLLLLMEHGAMYLRQEGDGLYWWINRTKMPQFRYLEPQKRGKCFSCLYWLDPDNEAEDYGKDSDELNCAVNPMHQDTQNGCEHYCNDWRKAELLKSWAVRPD